MNIFAEAQMMKTIFFSLAAVVLAALIVFLVIMIAKNKKKADEIKYFKKKLHQTQRNELLNKAISNYSKQKNRNYWLVKIVEINQFGKTEHFFNLNDNDVSVGRDFKSNSLCIFDEELDLNQCKVELHKETPYFVNVSEKVETTFTMKRKNKRQADKKHTMRVGESIRLFSLDSVSFGETKLEFYVYNSHLGIV